MNMLQAPIATRIRKASIPSSLHTVSFSYPVQRPRSTPRQEPPDGHLPDPSRRHRHPVRPSRSKDHRSRWGQYLPEISWKRHNYIGRPDFSAVTEFHRPMSWFRFRERTPRTRLRKHIDSDWCSRHSLSVLPLSWSLNRLVLFRLNIFSRQQQKNKTYYWWAAKFVICK